MAKNSDRSSRLPLDASTWALTRRLLRDYVRRHVGRIVVAVLCMAAVAACTAGFTQLIKPIVNDIFVVWWLRLRQGLLAREVQRRERCR